MSSWVAFTILAAFMQAVRTAFQKTLAEKSSVAAATLARSLFALPFTWIYFYSLWSLSSTVAEFKIDETFFLLATAAAILQITATFLMVKLFQQRNYAIGISYAKTEAILVAVLGLLLLEETLSLSGWVGIVIGMVGIYLLNPAVKTSKDRSITSHNLTTMMMGLASGLGFALTSLSVRHAGISLGDSLITNAALTLSIVLTLQTVLLGGYMLIAHFKHLKVLMIQWRLALLVGISSVCGSIGWFTAMTLENAALVKTLGQIEFFFMLLLSTRFFKERLKRHELFAMVLIVISILCILIPMT